MARIRLRKDNPSGRTQDILDIFGEVVKVDTENWIELTESDIRALCINPTLYEIEGVKVDDKKGKSK